MSRIFLSNSAEETVSIGVDIAKTLVAGDKIAFIGGLGMGKTCITSGIAKGLGYEGDVTSPTFNIVNEYRGGRLPLFHFDLYRISGFEDLYSTGFFDYADEMGVMVCEWSENISSVFDDNTIYIKFERIDDSSRKITLFKGSESSENPIC